MSLIRNKKFIVTLILMTIAVSAISYFFYPIGTKDPDRYYHLRLSQITADEGIQTTFPQADDLGWAQQFPDKEFLFHIVTSGFHLIGGEKFVEMVPFVIFLAAMLTLCVTLFYLHTSWWIPLMAVLVLLTNTHFLARMVLLRPHLLGILIFCLLILACLKRSTAAIVAMCFTFALAYHAIYVPLVVLGLFSFCNVLDRNYRSLKTVGYALIALSAGVIVSPYFPGNFLMTIQHLKIAAGLVKIDKFLFGMELIRPDSKEFLLTYVILLVSVLVQITHAIHCFYTSEKRSTLNCVFILLVSVVFVLLTFISPRANEYAFPVCFLGLCYGVSGLSGLNRYVPVAILVMIIACVSVASMRFPHLSEPYSGYDEKFKTIEKIPDTPGLKIYNCSWSDSPFLYYKRPDLKWVDLLDPSFLHQKNKEVFNIRNELNEGLVVDSYAVLKDVFKADYIICDRRARFDGDPNVVVVFPKTIEDFVRSDLILYQVNSERRREQVLSFKYKKIGDMKISEILKVNYPESMSDALDWPDEADRKEGSGTLTPSFLGFRYKYPMQDINDVIVEAKEDLGNSEKLEKFYDTRKSIANSMECFAVEPTASEIARLAGSDVLTVGGGAHIQLWKNEEPLYVSDDIRLTPTPVWQTLILKQPIQQSDILKAIVCTYPTRLGGFTLGLWHYEALKKVCLQRTQPLEWRTGDYEQWPDSRLKIVSCLNQ